MQSKISSWRVWLSFLAVCSAMPFDAVAEIYNLTSSNVRPTALADPAKWETSAGDVCSAFSHSDDFVNSSCVLFMRTNNLDNGYFQGGSLSIGGEKNGSAVFYLDNGQMIGFADHGHVANGGLLFYKGVMALNSSATDKSATIAGRVAVTASGSAPFHIHSQTAGNILEIAADFVSGADNALDFGWSHNGGKISNLAIGTCKTDITLRLTGDCSNFLGTLTMTGAVDHVDISDACEATSFGSMLVLSNTTFSGTVVLNGGSVLAANSPTDVCTVATLTLRPNSVLLVPCAAEFDSETGFPCARTNALLRVAQAVNVEGPVCIAMPGCVALPDGNTNRIMLLSAPSGSNLDPSCFTFAAESLPPVPCRLVAEDIGGAEVLFLEVEPYALLATSDSSSILKSVTTPGNELPSSLTNAAAWSDGKLPHAGVNYVVQKNPLTEANRCLRTPGRGYRSSVEYTFPGRRLIIDSGCLLVSHCGQFQSTDQPIRFLDGGILAYVHSQSTRFVGGLDVGEGSFFIRPYVISATTVDKLYGSGTVVGGDLTMNKQDAIGGAYHFEDTSGFTGKFNMQTTKKSAVDAGSDRRQTLFVHGNALGGARGEFTPDALLLTDHAALKVDEASPTQTLANAYNAGVKVDGAGHVVLGDSTERLRIDWPITWDGTLYKEGSGTLSLGGSSLFGDDCAAGPVPGGTNDLVVAEGTLEIAASAAVDGCRVMVSNGTSVVVKYTAGDAVMLGSGLRNAKTTEPFVLCGVSDGKLPLSVDFSDWGGNFPDTAELALLTVTNDPDTVASVRGMMPARVGVSGLGRRYSQQPAEVSDAEGGTVTFLVQLNHQGLMLIVK